jgi:hypothetical protein
MTDLDGLIELNESLGRILRRLNALSHKPSEWLPHSPISKPVQSKPGSPK